jgi:hypothetical protein
MGVVVRIVREAPATLPAVRGEDLSFDVVADPEAIEQY